MVNRRKPFAFQSFIVHQENVSLPVTTDACLFGAIVAFDNPTNILDMGCGTGLLMLIQHQKHPQAQIIGIDLHPESVNTSNHNFRINNVNNQLSALHVDWWNYQPDTLFDGIICNPPFFANQLASTNPIKKQARHTDGYEIKELLPLVTNWLSPTGTCYLLTPYFNFKDISETWLSPNLGLSCTFYQAIQANHQSKPHLSILGFSKKHQECKPLPNLIVYDKPSNFTKEAMKLLQPFLQERALRESR